MRTYYVTEFEPPLQFTLAAMFGTITSLFLLVTLLDIETGFRGSFGLFSPYCATVLAAVYVWRYVITQSSATTSQKRNAFILLLLSSLPFIYWKCVLTPNINVVGHALLAPLWILVVPLFFFFRFDLVARKIKGERLMERMFFELAVCVPLWSGACSVFAVATGLARDYRYLAC